jgi:hypothetical protein
MDRTLDDIEQQVEGGRNFDAPPLDKWHPDLSGDIPIVIKSDGTWYHDGGRIEREALVRLFASILRREEDGEYYLVTPVEKWRIQVEAHALLVTDVEAHDKNGEQLLVARLNTGREIEIGPDNPLFLDPELDGVAALSLPHGLTAVLTRAAWYRLVDMAEEVDGTPLVRSAGQTYKLVK